MRRASHAWLIAMSTLALAAMGIAQDTARDDRQREERRKRDKIDLQQQEAAKKFRRSAEVPIGSPPDLRFNRDFYSWQELNERNVVMQQRDYSCGAAALATMARYYFRDNVTEKQVLDLALKGLTPRELEDRRDNGLSMDDLFKAAKRLNYQATVYELELEKLKELQAPIIVRTIKDDYKHFVVLRGVQEDRVWLADPIRGNHRIPVAEFVQQWNGVALFLGKEGFGLPKQHLLALPDAQYRPELRAAQRSVLSDRAHGNMRARATR